MTELTAPTATLTANPGAGVVCAVKVRHPAYHVLQRHHVWPKSWGGPEDGELVNLCGLHHDDVHHLLAAMRKAGTWQVGQAKAGYSPQVRALAHEGWKRAHPS